MIPVTNLTSLWPDDPLIGNDLDSSSFTFVLLREPAVILTKSYDLSRNISTKWNNLTQKNVFIEKQHARPVNGL